MIKQIKSSDIKKFIEDNPSSVLLDVRTEDEWNTVGKPDTKILGIKTYFITISQEPSFLESIKKLGHIILIIHSYLVKIFLKKEKTF